MPAAPTTPVQRRGLPTATGAPRDIVDYIDAHFHRQDTNLERERRRRAAAALDKGGLGVAVGGTDKLLPGMMTPERRIERDLRDLARVYDTRESLTGHARAPYTRQLRTLVRTLLRAGLTLDQIVERASAI
jgi:hypothetical protein